MKKLISLSLMLMVAACASTQTRAPKVSKSELQQEQQAQYELAKQMQGKTSNGVAKIDQAMADEFRTVAGKVGAAGAQLCQQIGGKNCVFGFQLEESADLNAYADGKNIVVSSKMAEFADTDELANVIAHEYAHNVMGHVAKQQQNATLGTVAGSLLDALAASQGVDTGGTGSKIAGSVGVMHYSQAFESEADYVGLYIMERAGYDITKAPNLWRKMSIADTSGIQAKGRYGSSHPSNPQRYIALNKTINEIAYKKQNNLPLVPEFRKK